MPKKKQLFINSGKTSGAVLLNWHGTPEREFTHFAEAFRLLAQQSAASLKTNRHFGLDGIPIEDFKVYPVVFLYRHALELYMKAILLVGAPMQGLKGLPELERDKVLKTHDLEVLRHGVESVFEAFDWNCYFGTPRFQTVDDLRAVVAEFHEVDRGSHSFRYPVDPKGRASLKQGFQFDLFEFCSVLDELFETLEGAAIGVSYELDEALRARGEAQDYERESREHEYEIQQYDDCYGSQD